MNNDLVDTNSKIGYKLIGRSSATGTCVQKLNEVLALVASIGVDGYRCNLYRAGSMFTPVSLNAWARTYTLPNAVVNEVLNAGNGDFFIGTIGNGTFSIVDHSNDNDPYTIDVYRI